MFKEYKTIMVHDGVTGSKVTCAKDIVKEFDFLIHEPQEHLYLINFNAANEVLSSVLISKGTVNYSVFSFRDIFREFLNCPSASSFAICHNHPSGNYDPSIEDKKQTKRLYEASKFMDFRFLDHIIVAEEGFFSFDENNMMNG